VLGPMQTTVIPLKDDGYNPQGDTGEILANVISHSQPGTDTRDSAVVQASIARSGVSPLSALVVSLATGAGVSPLVRVVPSGTGVLQIVLDGPTTGTVPVALDASDLAVLLGADSDGTLRLNAVFTGARCTLNVNYQSEPSNTPYSVRIRADRLNNESFADVGTLLFAYPPPACLADVASDSLDTTRNPNGSVGAEDLDAFIASFITVCL